MDSGVCVQLLNAKFVPYFIYMVITSDKESEHIQNDFETK